MDPLFCIATNVDSTFVGWRRILLAIMYHCRHCRHVVGNLNQRGLSPTMLGIDQLSVEDKSQMVTYKENGDVHVQTICENCEQTLKEHPHYYEMDHFLQ